MIDADALKKEFPKDEDLEYPVNTNGYVCEKIDEQPTIEERKKGKWINYRNDDGHIIADCNQCGNAIQWFDGDEIPRYCCMCGADMRGEGDETICD